MLIGDAAVYNLRENKHALQLNDSLSEREVEVAVYLVTWDINRAKANYPQARANLIARLEKYEHIRDPGLDSVWFLSDHRTSSNLVADIRIALDDDDRLVVTRMFASHYDGRMREPIWDWIFKRL